MSLNRSGFPDFESISSAFTQRELVAIIGQWLLALEPVAIARLAVEGKTLQLFFAVTHHLRMTHPKSR